MTPNKKSSLLGIYLVPIFLLLVFLLLLIVPLSSFFLNIDGKSIESVFGNDSFPKIIKNSFLASSLTTIISFSLAFALAWCLERTNMPCKKVFKTLISLPMLIPSVSIGMGIVILGGNNGILTNLLHIKGGLYGLLGIVIGSVMYSLPVAVLMISNILKFEDSSQYEAAQVLGISKWHSFWSISLPYMKKPLISVIFSVFTLSFTDYGVPLMIGGKFKTLPMVMYQEVIGQLNFGKGCVYGIILLAPAIIAFLLDIANKNNSNSTYVTKPFENRKHFLKDSFSFLITLILSLSLMLPIFSFILLAFVKKYPSDMTITFDNFIKTFQLGAGDYLLNSILIAIFTSLFGVIFAIISAYFSARCQASLSKFIHLFSMSSGAVPGIVLGLSYAIFFKNSSIYGTIIILAIVNMIHFFASPYLMIYTAFSKMNSNLEDVGATLGIGKIRMIKDVLIKNCNHTIKEMFSFFFVNSMMTISAVSFLSNTSNKPLALMINQFEAQAKMEAAAVVSLIILVVNMTTKLILERKSN